MTVNAAELVAQVIVGLFIAFAVEAKSVGDFIRMHVASIAEGDDPIVVSHEMREARRFIVIYSLLFVFALLGMTCGLALCLHSVIANRPMPDNGALLVAFGMIFGISLAMVVPSLQLVGRFLEGTNRDLRLPNVYYIILPILSSITMLTLLVALTSAV